MVSSFDIANLVVSADLCTDLTLPILRKNTGNFTALQLRLCNNNLAL